MNKCAITLDVDMNFEGSDSDNCHYFEECFENIKSILVNFNEIKTTWFIRVDNEIKEKYGEADYLLKKYNNQMKWLTDNGHQLGWHAHCKFGSSVYSNLQEKERTKLIIGELDNNIQIVSEYGLQKCFRMGSCLMNDDILNYLEKSGVQIDCSALPRPNYSWVDKMIRWNYTSYKPYYPKADNYQITSLKKCECRKIIEVPMTTLGISASYDSIPDIKRYINVAYKKEIFRDAINLINDDCVLIMHPEDICNKIVRKHELLSYSSIVLKENLRLVKNIFECVTIADYVN